MSSVFWNILILIVCAVHIIRSIRDIRRYDNYTIPRQLLHLVQQAHTGQPSRTLWDIEVSEEMKIALRAPLTAQQIYMFSQLTDEKICTSVYGYVVSHKSKDGELTGVVCVSIDISSDSGIYNCKYSGVKLRIKVSQIGKPIDGKWIVSSVEQIP